LGRTFVNHDVVNALLDGQYGLGMSAWQDIPAKFRTKEVLHRIVNHESKNFRGKQCPAQIIQNFSQKLIGRNSTLDFESN